MYIAPQKEVMKNSFNKTIEEKFPDLKKEVTTHVQETYRKQTKIRIGRYYPLGIRAFFFYIPTTVSHSSSPPIPPTFFLPTPLQSTPQKG